MPLENTSMRQVIASFAILMLCGLGADRGACAEEMQITVDGYARSYLIERPNTSRPSPTVIMLHGANQTAGSIAQQTDLLRLGPQDGFVDGSRPRPSNFFAGSAVRRTISAF